MYMGIKKNDIKMEGLPRKNISLNWVLFHLKIKLIKGDNYTLSREINTKKLIKGDKYLTIFKNIYPREIIFKTNLCNLLWKIYL